MGRPKRSAKAGGRRDALAASRASTPEPGPHPDGDAAPPAPRRTVRIVRHRCPACGMLPEVYRYRQSPYATEVRIIEMGGSLPEAARTKPGRGPQGILEFHAADPLAELWGALLWLHVAREAQAAVLEVLPDLFADAGLEPPNLATDAAVRAVLDAHPRDALLDHLLAADDLYGPRTARA